LRIENVFPWQGVIQKESFSAPGTALGLAVSPALKKIPAE
jgi:hypothetical protein